MKTHSLLLTKSPLAKSKILKNIVEIILGSLFLSLCSQVSIRVGPVPISMQTFAVFIIGTWMSKKTASMAALVYLIEATLGFPVLAGWTANPLWFLGMSGGYLLSFPIVAFLIGWIMEKRKKPSFLWVSGSILCGQFVIYLCGVSQLSLYIGLEGAIRYGLYPFLALALVKAIAAASLRISRNR